MGLLKRRRRKKKEQDTETADKEKKDENKEKENKDTDEEKKKISSILPTKLYVARAQKRKERKEYLLRQFSLRPGRRESFRYYELYQYSRQTMPDYVESERSSIETIGKRQHFR